MLKMSAKKCVLAKNSCNYRQKLGKFIRFRKNGCLKVSLIGIPYLQ